MSGALLSAAWITRAPASAASADISTKSEWRAASSGGRVISAAASHPGASASACNVTRVLSTAPTMTARIGPPDFGARSEEHTSELQSLMRISYAVFCLKKKKNKNTTNIKTSYHN